MSGEHPSEAERLSRAEGEIAAIKETQRQIATDLHEIKASLNLASKANWPLILSALGVLVAIFIPSMGAMFMFVNFQIRNAVSPLESRSEVSIRDRGEIHQQTVRNAEGIAELRAMDGKTTEQLREVETQIKLLHDAANLRYSENEKFIALLWKKSYSEDFPVNPYYVQPKVMP